LVCVAARSSCKREVVNDREILAARRPIADTRDRHEQLPLDPYHTIHHTTQGGRAGQRKGAAHGIRSQPLGFHPKPNAKSGHTGSQNGHTPRLECRFAMPKAGTTRQERSFAPPKPSSCAAVHRQRHASLHLRGVEYESLGVCCCSLIM